VPTAPRCPADACGRAVLVGKKNLEVRPSAVNKGEIVKRILYRNPDAEFVFCAGDDKVRLARTTACTARR
jgi:trehalose-6-phosphatase